MSSFGSSLGWTSCGWRILVRLAPLARCRSGAAATEAAAMLPLFALLLAGLFDFGTAVMDSMALGTAARAGAQYALTQPADTAGITAVAAAATRLDAATLTINATTFCECPDGGSIGCSGSCGAGQPVHRFVSVHVTRPFTSLLPYPGFMRPSQLSGTAVLRVT